MALTGVRAGLPPALPWKGKARPRAPARGPMCSRDTADRSAAMHTHMRAHTHTHALVPQAVPDGL